VCVFLFSGILLFICSTHAQLRLSVMTGTTAPLTATRAPPPAVVPASTPALAGGLTTGFVAQTNYLGGTVISTLPPNLQVEGGFVV
jgi:hypothetical protein